MLNQDKNSLINSWFVCFELINVCHELMIWHMNIACWSIWSSNNLPLKFNIGWNLELCWINLEVFVFENFGNPLNLPICQYSLESMFQLKILKISTLNLFSRRNECRTREEHNFHIIRTRCLKEQVIFCYVLDESKFFGITHLVGDLRVWEKYWKLNDFFQKIFFCPAVTKITDILRHPVISIISSCNHLLIAT